MLRKCVKTACFLALLVFFASATALARLIARGGNQKAWLAKIASLSSWALLRALGVSVTVRDNQNIRQSAKNYFIVSNHVSYLDIFIISSLVPSIFIANSELKDDPLLGNVIKLGGGVFVERRNRSSLMQDMASIGDLLGEGANVVLFPEGTTSDGEGLLPFKSSFLDLAARAKSDTLLVCVRYRGVNGDEITPENRDLIYYYGGMKFFEHFFRLMEQKCVSAEITFIETVPAGSLSRKELAKRASEVIAGVYGVKSASPPSSAGTKQASAG
ncbi:MAG: 1-acyl-sn-glycerol-3-phosphate acyltransferase [Deltaproteobacteria bacterium]